VLLCTQVDIIWACANCLLKLWAGLAALAKPTPTGGWRCWINYSIQVCFSTNQGMSLPRRIDSYLWNPMGTVWVKIICQPPKKIGFGHFLSSWLLTLQREPTTMGPWPKTKFLIPVLQAVSDELHRWHEGPLAKWMTAGMRWSCTYPRKSSGS